MRLPCYEIVEAQAPPYLHFCTNSNCHRGDNYRGDKTHQSERGACRHSKPFPQGEGLGEALGFGRGHNFCDNLFLKSPRNTLLFNNVTYFN
jgi:hypothetical protein